MFAILADFGQQFFVFQPNSCAPVADCAILVTGQMLVFEEHNGEDIPSVLICFRLRQTVSRRNGD